MALENEYDIPFSLLNLQGSPDFTLTLPFFFFSVFFRMFPISPSLNFLEKFSPFPQYVSILGFAVIESTCG